MSNRKRYNDEIALALVRRGQAPMKAPVMSQGEADSLAGETFRNQTRKAQSTAKK